MCEQCPPAHREILVLKRQGLLLSEIAARTGLHEGSIRRILYDLARRLAVPRRMNATSGGPAQGSSAPQGDEPAHSPK
jgi:RNA polymerase sigma-70 factor (ECF subfamily)